MSQVAPEPAEVKYPMTEEKYARVDRDFLSRMPKEGQAERYRSLREFARQFALHILMTTPPSREQELAMAALRNAVLWAGEAIKGNE